VDDILKDAMQTLDESHQTKHVEKIMRDQIEPMIKDLIDRADQTANKILTDGLVEDINQQRLTYDERMIFYLLGLKIDQRLSEIFRNKEMISE